MHTDLGPGEAGSALFGWILAMLGQQHGFPFPVGGAGQLAAALGSRAAAAEKAEPSPGNPVKLASQLEEVVMKGIVLWLMGVPVVVIIGLYVFNIL